MKRSLIIFALLLFAVMANAQSYTSPGIPSGTTSLIPTFRTKAATPDSLAQIWLAIGGNKFYRMLSGMDVIVFDAKVVQGLGTTSSKLTFRDTLLKPNWVINPADTLHPVLTLIQKKSQDNLWLKGTGITDGRAAIRFTTEKDTGDYEYGFLAGGDNNLYGLRNVRAATPPNISWVWSVNAHNGDYTNFYRHVGMTGLTDTSTAAKIVAIDANGKLFKVPYSGGGGTTPNPFTAATSGGASPGTTFDGSVARTFDYSSFGAAPAFTATGSGVILSSGNLGLGGSTTSSRTINFNTHFLEFTGTDFGGTTGTTIFQGNGFSSNITNAGGDHYGINISTAQAQLNGNNGSGNVASVNASSNHADLVFTDGSGINSISSTDNGIHIGSTIDFKAAYYDDVYLLPTGNYIPSKRQVDSIAKTKADSIFSGGGGGGNNIYNHTDSLTGNRKVNFVTHKLELGDVPNNRAYVGIDPTNSSINLYTYGLSGGTGNSTYTQNDESIFISNSDTSGYSGGFQIANNDAAKATTMVIINHGVQSSLSLHAYGENIFDDAIASKGIVYANNYGANFTDRSLVDKRYVDSVRAGGGAFLPLSFTSNTAIQQNGNKWDVYANNSSGGLHMQSDSLSGFDLYTSDSADAAHSEYTQNSDGANISTTNASNFANISTTGATGKVFMGSGDAAGDNPNISITPTDVIIEYQRFDGMSKAIILDSLSNNGIRINDDSNIGLAGTTLFPVSGDPNQFVQAGNLPSTTIHTSNGLSGDGSIGTPVVLGGTFSGNIDEDVGANSIDWHGDNGTYAVDNLIDNTPGGSLISSQASNSAGSHYAAVNIGITSPTGWYAELATNKSGSGASIQLDGNTGNTTITNTLGSFGAQYGADYSTALRLNPNGIASVKVVKDMADSVKGTISSAAGANPTASIGFTAVNGSASTFTRSDGAPKADSTVIRSVANSYSLSGMQTKLNNYALTSALPVGANPTGTAGTSAVNGSATTFMRSDAAPKVDSAVFRTVANSYSLSGLQTKFNGYVPTSTTVAGFALSSNVTLAALTATDATLTFSGSYTGATARTVGLNLGQANTWTADQTHQLTSLGTTPSNAIEITNGTAATSGTPNQYSPSLHFGAQVWNTTSVAANNWSDWRIYVSTGSGTSPAGTLNFDYSLSTTSTPSYSNKMTLDKNGTLALANSISANNATFNGVTTLGGSLGTGTQYNLWLPASTDGYTAQTASQYLYAGATNINIRTGLGGGSLTNTQIANGNVYGGVVVASSPMVLAASAVVPWASRMVIKAPGTITFNSGSSITNNALLYIENPGTSGTNNYALYVAGGTTQLNGKLFYSNPTAGTAGTDSIAVHKSDGQLKVISPTYYATQASQPIHGNSTTTGTATTVVTVTIGSTMANTNYIAKISPQDLVTAVNWYISAKTTTTFDVTFVSALTGSINFDWEVTP